MIGTYPSILMHQQFTVQGCVGRNKKAVFSKKKSEFFEKMLQNAGGKVLERVVPPFRGRQSIFSQSQIFWNTLFTVPSMHWHWQGVAHHGFLQSISSQATVSFHRENQEKLHFYVWSLFLQKFETIRSLLYLCFSGGSSIRFGTPREQLVQKAGSISAALRWSLTSILFSDVGLFPSLSADIVSILQTPSLKRLKQINFPILTKTTQHAS